MICVGQFSRSAGRSAGMTGGAGAFGWTGTEKLSTVRPGKTTMACSDCGQSGRGVLPERTRELQNHCQLASPQPRNLCPAQQAVGPSGVIVSNIARRAAGLAINACCGQIFCVSRYGKRASHQAARLWAADSVGGRQLMLNLTPQRGLHRRMHHASLLVMEGMCLGSERWAPGKNTVDCCHR